MAWVMPLPFHTWTRTDPSSARSRTYCAAEGAPNYGSDPEPCPIGPTDGLLHCDDRPTDVTPTDREPGRSPAQPVVVAVEVASDEAELVADDLFRLGASAVSETVRDHRTRAVLVADLPPVAIESISRPVRRGGAPGLVDRRVARSRPGLGGGTVRGTTALGARPVDVVGPLRRRDRSGRSAFGSGSHASTRLCLEAARRPGADRIDTSSTSGAAAGSCRSRRSGSGAARGGGRRCRPGRGVGHGGERRGQRSGGPHRGVGDTRSRPGAGSVPTSSSPTCWSRSSRTSDRRWSDWCAPAASSWPPASSPTKRARRRRARTGPDRGDAGVAAVVGRRRPTTARCSSECGRECRSRGASRRIHGAIPNIACTWCDGPVNVRS